MIQHHIKYLELHGVDEIVEITRSEHLKLHNRLRREGKCNVPVDVLRKISRAARERSPKVRAQKKAYNKAYHASHIKEEKAYQKTYQAVHRDEHNARNKKYYANHREERQAYNKAYRAAKKLEAIA